MVAKTPYGNETSLHPAELREIQHVGPQGHIEHVDAESGDEVSTWINAPVEEAIPVQEETVPAVVELDELPQVQG